MSLSSYLKNIFLFVIYGTIIYFGYSYFTKNPCDTPVTYSIGRIDTQFGINKNDVEEYTKEASSLWNSALNKPLLKETISGDITINFIFDERQRATIQTEKLKQQIDEQKQNLDAMKQNLAVLKSDYDNKLNAYNVSQDLYNKELDAYNKSVDYWNSQGGAPQSDYDNLLIQKESLQNKYTDLNNSLNELQRLATQINTYSDTHNSIADQVNKTIKNINVNAGKTFEEGLYDPNAKTITIYEYESVTGLKRVLAHELGHALGLDHVQNKKSIMYYLNEAPDFKLSNEDVSALKVVCKI